MSELSSSSPSPISGSQNPAQASAGRLPRIAWRRVLGWIHLWTGLILALPLILLGVSGSLLVYGDDAMDKLMPGPAAVATGTPQPIAAQLAAARHAVEAIGQAGLAPSFYLAPAAAGEAARVRLTPAGRGPQPAGGALQVALDPVSLVVLSVSDPFAGPLSIVHRLHANLLIPGRDGRVVVGFLGVVMLGFCVTGLVLWWPRAGRWLAAFVVKRGAGSLRFNRDLHGATGIWTLPVLFLVSFSGSFIVFPETMGAGINALVGPGIASPVPGVTASAPLDADGAVAVAARLLPGYRPAAISLPGRPGQPLRLRLAPLDGPEGAPVATLILDSGSGKVLELRDPRHLSGGGWLAAWMRPLHEGKGLGMLWRFAVFVCGLLPALFAITGITMWLVKRRVRRQRVDGGRRVVAASVAAIGVLLLTALPALAQAQAQAQAQGLPEVPVSTPLAPPMALTPWDMFLAADWVVKSVLTGLFAASLVTWAIALTKAIEIGAARRRLRAALPLLDGAASLAEAAGRIPSGNRGEPAALVLAAVQETRLSGGALEGGLIDRVGSRLDRIQAAARQRLGRGTGILATIGATAPFIGLFGTVWGIMNSFVGIARLQTTNLAVVAPGIAEALLATAIGLVAAIPAVVAYNALARGLAAYRALLTDLGAAILRLVSRDLDRRAGGLAPVATGRSGTQGAA